MLKERKNKEKRITHMQYVSLMHIQNMIYLYVNICMYTYIFFGGVGLGFELRT
jgi:hypothetical protein